MKPHNVFHPHRRCTRSHRTLNQPLVLGCVPQTTRPGWQENVCSASPTPSTQAVAHLAVHVSPFCNCVKFSGPKMCKRLSLDSHKKISGTSTKWLYPDTQLTVQISPTNLLEQPSLLSGVTHTPSSRARASAPRPLLKELVVAHCSLSCYKEVARLRTPWNDFGFLQLTTFTLARQSLSSFQWRSCPHRGHGSFCLSLSSLALRSSED